MAGKGAPEGNQYARKGRAGRTIGLYITPEELAILETALKKQGDPAEKLDVDRYARQLFKEAVLRLSYRIE